MDLAEVKTLESCWTAHRDGQVALAMKLGGSTVAVQLDMGKIEELRQKLTEAEMFLMNYYNERGR